MNIHLHINELVLEGLDVASGQRSLVLEAMQAELTRLLSLGELGIENSIAVPSLRADAISLTHDASPQKIGLQIARSVYGGLKQ